ncbi:MFS transporter, CP family, cyanate transporter [Brevibacterium siliguriense]|uniref:MFS transporter, CP family, cyanate transporter n=1 Tax=Brevibacterium siliguriense TaxID=1136497 RepID=A0A1H1MR72_9MICO|nr:MFS transporter [Brevibacterium siliguriense]SDR88389.1 MFS transporter, CP family, cyanate transporter [Brevibacterium siliguriense]
MLPWIILGIVILALNLRTPIIAPTAILPDIQEGTGFSAAGLGLLTGLPVLLFALATPVAGKFITRLGAEATVLACLSGVLLGTVLRSVGPSWLVLVGTGIIGLAITLGNIVVPVLIRREVPWEQVSMVTGLYSAMMNVGSMATLIGTGPLAEAFGWRWALAAWGGLAFAGLGFWMVLIRVRVRRDGEAARAAAAESADDPSTVEATAPAAKQSWAEAPASFRWIIALLIITFSGQSTAYYVTTTWLPSYLGDTIGLAPTAAGSTASLFQIAAILGAFGVPLLAVKTKPWVPVAIVAVLWLSLPVGLLMAPGAYCLWASTGGIAQGGGFTAIFSIIARTAGSDAQTASASARVQFGGYLAATLAPPFAGWLNTATGGWTAPLLLILAATLAFTITGLLAARRAGGLPRGGREILDPD